MAERAHEVLAPSLAHEPEEKTYIVIEDTTDSSNGFASVIPRNSIRLFASAPPSKSALSDHDDWLYALTLHEYAHILHLDNISGLPYWVNKVVGKTWAPNQIQPRWVIEGLATYVESKYSSGGRTRFSLFDMQLRMATLSDNERGLDEMSNGPRAWPHGNTAYMYGSHFLKYIFDRFGDDKAGEMSTNLGGNPIPYGINRSIRQATGKGFVELHADWKKHRRDRYALQQEAVERAGRREGRRLTFSAEVNFNPRITRDGKQIIWQHGTGFQEGELGVMPLGGNAGQIKTYAIVRRGGEFDVLSDGSLVIEQTEVYRGLYSSQELFHWDSDTHEMRQLTKRKRIRDPAVSPNERRVAFVMNDKSQRRLAIMDLAPGAQPEIIWSGADLHDQAFDPAWSPDGSKVAFSSWVKGGFRNIVVVDLESGDATTLTSNRAHDVDPAFDPQGRYLYYSSDRTGIFNVYAYELETGKLQQVSNVLGCALTPAISPDGKRMVYQGFVADGFELYEMTLDPNAWTTAPLYVNDRPDSIVVHDDDYPTTKPRPYRPLETLAPRSYEFEADAINQRLNINIHGTDIVGRHSYTLATSTDLRTGRSNFGSSYGYAHAWIGMRLAATRVIGERGGFVIDGRNTSFLQEQLGATATFSLPVLRSPDASGSLSLSYDFDRLRNAEDQYEGPNPNDMLPRRPESDTSIAGVALRFSYSDTRGSAYTLGPQQGQGVSLSMRVNHPALASDSTSLSLDYRYTRYRRLPWGDTPVLSFRFGGGIRFSSRRTPRFSLGGIPQQDVVQSLLDNARAGTTGFLRGYEQGAVSGSQMHLANIEYRQELWNIETGLETLPFYLKKLHVAGLFDAGNAFDDDIDLSKFKTSVGISLRLNMLFGYFVPGALDIGYARGLNEGGIHQWWTLITGTI